MKTLTVSAARKRFGSLLDAVQQEPIIVRRKNGDEVVIVSAERYKKIYGITSEPIEPIARKRRSLKSR
jgi:prevent-host-death family protein